MPSIEDTISAELMAEFGIPARLRPCGAAEALTVTVRRLENPSPSYPLGRAGYAPSPDRQAHPSKVAISRIDGLGDLRGGVLEIMEASYAGLYDITAVEAHMAGAEWCLGLCMQGAQP